MSELVQVFSHYLGGGFTEIRRVGYCFMSLQPNRRFVYLLVWLNNDEDVVVSFGCHRRLMPNHVMNFLVKVGEAGSPSGSPVAAAPVRVAIPRCDECIPDTAATGCPPYILPAPPPIPRLADVHAFYRSFT
ncbi:hypothetical protein PIB30_017078 [Stylosanthes scabra]|uniref:Uncharacterized protein n=1 Tax=Stylosanthes scabra TaxID=79078 RepID=A0ABU6T8P0_9FABA|nr:hypothetical protein [Stylosanthes scabra]